MSLPPRMLPRGSRQGMNILAQVHYARTGHGRLIRAMRSYSPQTDPERPASGGGYAMPLEPSEGPAILARGPRRVLRLGRAAGPSRPGAASPSSWAATRTSTAWCPRRPTRRARTACEAPCPLPRRSACALTPSGRTAASTATARCRTPSWTYCAPKRRTCSRSASTRRSWTCLPRR